MRALLDVSVLIPLLDQQHEHNEAAQRWLEDNVRHGWATCAITENGALRIMSQSRYMRPWRVEKVAQALVDMTDTKDHEFWPDASLLEYGVIDWHQVNNPKQITDLYLLVLAAKNNGRLVTFDRRIAKGAVPVADDETCYVIPTP